MANFPASLLILNGKSADNQPLREAITLLRDEGIQIHVRVTWEKGDAQRYVDEARRLGVETVIAGGGDGTINEVSTALIQIRDGVAPALGLLPLGTANDFATSAGIPEALDKALKLAIAGNAMEIDMARVNDKTCFTCFINMATGGKTCFINMATGGFGTRITTETPEKLKAALGGVSYLIHGLMRMDTLTPDRCEIRGENFHWQGDALVIGIGNGRQAGGGQQLCPTALINDGLLQLRIFTGEELLPALFSTLTQSDDNPNIIDGAHEITFNL
ncbi:lipid kinase, partial [Salmonella enterica subsp. enterica serovar Alachua str. R6-377]